MTVSVNITGLDPIAAAINSLAQAMGASRVTAAIAEAPTAKQPVQTAAPQQVVQAAAQPAAPQAPASAQVMPPQAAVPPAAPQPVQTAAVAYTQDDLARAAMALMDSGRQGDLRGLLAQFGVDSLPHLPATQYGAFATALRGLGAQI